MDELIALVVERTGIPQETARQAVETVIEFVKGKLPPALAGQVDALIAGEGGLDLSQGMGMLGSLLGKK